MREKASDIFQSNVEVTECRAGRRTGRKCMECCTLKMKGRESPGKEVEVV